MEEKISLEASGMPGVIKAMEKHFGKLIEKASGKKEPVSVKTVPTSVIPSETKFPVPVLAESKDVASQCGVSADHYQNDDEARESTQISSVGYKAPATDSRGGENSSVIVGAPDKGMEMFSMMLYRDYLDDELEVVVEILDYIPEHQGGCHDERLASSVEMGDAFTLDGKEIELTPLEAERAAEGALAMIESRKAE